MRIKIKNSVFDLKKTKKVYNGFYKDCSDYEVYFKNKLITKIKQIPFNKSLGINFLKELCINSLKNDRIIKGILTRELFKRIKENRSLKND